MKFGYTILYVDDVGRMLDFYVAAFGLSVRFLHESGDFGELETGGTALAFSSRALMRQLGKQPSAPVSGALSAGARLVQAPEAMPWGQTVAYVADLEGFLVELCTPVGG